MLLYQLVVTFILLIPFGIALWNYRSFATIRRIDRPASYPRVSVLVPARNEERTIERCILSLLQQEYPDYHIVALDDESEDRTGAILRELAAGDPRLTVIRGEPLPAEWVGKNWACHQLAQHADGEWLLFTDADTGHSPASIAACIGFAERMEVQFLSGIPYQQMPGFWEQVIIPMGMFLYFAYLPNRWIIERSDPKFCATNGQILCISRQAYRKIGGHEGVRSQLVEDVWLGRAAKRAGIRTALATAVETAECRMYASLGGVVSGFSKNLFPGFDYSLPGLTFFLISTLLLYLAPLCFVVMALLTGRDTVELLWLPVLHLLLAMIMRGMLALRFRMSWRQILYHPLSALMIAIIALNSARWAYSRRGTTWKGRSYGRVRA